MEKMELYEKVRSVPEKAKKEIGGGRLKGMTDINPMWRIKVLTEQFGPCGIGWYYKPVRKWLEAAGNEIAAFVDIELFVKYDGEWSAPISGTGGSKFFASESKNRFMSDECYKMATTDALSVACKQLGIGADVYFSQDKTKYDQQPKQEKQSTDRKINAVELMRIKAASERTGFDLNDYLSKYGIPLERMGYSSYCKLMIGMATCESIVPANAPHSDGSIEVPDDCQEELPFR
ncbi:hypothetical protein [uncultured Blautia sp.]|uniref:hypothetical protein n=1 Tax=Blautia marasmi TaxID=1917868 RepID=UPI00259AC23E|nr:hypothetical protein [uncultured Blautia sp.]